MTEETGGESVVAEDGKTYEFGKKQKVRKESSVLENGDVVTRFVFRNGEIREHLTSRHSDVYAQLARHGADQKFGDEFAGEQDVDDCVLAFEQMSSRLSRGEWSEKRSSDGLSGTSMLVRALVKVTGQEVGAVKTKLEGVDAKTKAALAKQPKIAQAIAEIKAERDAKKGSKDAIDPDEALAALGLAA
jgi:hypothetical protein